MAVLLFTGYPVSFILEDLTPINCFLGMLVNHYDFIKLSPFSRHEFEGFVSRYVSLVAVPIFIFMVVIL